MTKPSSMQHIEEAAGALVVLIVAEVDTVIYDTMNGDTFRTTHDPTVKCLEKAKQVGAKLATPGPSTEAAWAILHPCLPAAPHCDLQT